MYSLVISKYDNSNIHTKILQITSDYGLLQVESIEYYTNTENYVFDIEVETNHNFVIGDNKSYIDGLLYPTVIIWCTSLFKSFV